MAVHGEIFITASGSEVEGARDNNSSLIFEFNHKAHLPYSRGMHVVQGHRTMTAFSIVKDIDKMTPLLYKAVDQGEDCEILIKLYRIAIDTGEEEEFFNYSLEHSRIVSVENWMPSSKIEANEYLGQLERIEILAGVFRCTYLDGGIEHEMRSFERT